MYKKIFHPSDFSEGDEIAFVHALKLALQTSADFTILHVSPNSREINWLDFPKVRSTLQRWSIASGQPENFLEENADLHVRKLKESASDPVKPIVDFITEAEPDLVVLATHQRKGFDRWIKRSIAENVARKNKERTLFIPRGHKGFVSPKDGAAQLSRVMIPVEFSPPPTRAFEELHQLTSVLEITDLEVNMVHVSDSNDMPAIRFDPPQGWHIKRTHLRGQVEESLIACNESYKPDLLIMMTKGRYGFLDALRGTTTECMVRVATCPILTVSIR